jgi:hypothetical protein
VLTGSETDTIDVAERLRPVLTGDFRVERLFPEIDPSDDPERLSQMFLVSAPDGKHAGEKDWDAAYRVQDETGFESVEPDAQATLEPATVASRGSCFRNDLDAPADHDWSLDIMRVRQAWALPLPPGGRSKGAGVLVCHPDTGWSEHRDLDTDGLDLTRGLNLVSGGFDAHDPLDYGGWLQNPGHGTATGSVIVSREETGLVNGVAPAATLVPIRATQSVVKVFDSDIAKAVDHAVRSGCDVISMSLGGKGFFGLESAVRRARRKNVIVLAAAGNCVRFVVAPASYENCLAVAATNREDRPWRGSSRGRKVDVSAPGEHVWVAHREVAADPDSLIKPGQGTSFAVASTAGVAALWLAYRGLDRDTYQSSERLQDLFQRLLRDTARRPAHWTSLDGQYGAGVVNAESLLKRQFSISLGSGARIAPETDLEILANTVDRPADSLAAVLMDRFSLAADSLAPFLERYGSELVQIALEDPDSFDRYLQESPAVSRRAAVARTALTSRASQRLGARMR